MKSLIGGDTIAGRVLELDLHMTADEARAACRKRGLVVTSERELAGQPGSRHWHLHRPGRTGTLELSASGNRVWVKVHPRRDGGWAEQLARELAQAPLVTFVERRTVRVMFKRDAEETQARFRSSSERCPAAATRGCGCTASRRRSTRGSRRLSRPWRDAPIAIVVVPASSSIAAGTRSTFSSPCADADLISRQTAFGKLWMREPIDRRTEDS